MGFIKLLKQKEFWTILAKGAGLYLLLFIMIIIGLRSYTNHGKSFPVPDFQGLKPERVHELAKSRKLQIEIIDSNFVAYLPKGSVIDQYPAPGVNVKKNRTIFLTINAFNQAKVEMPPVVNFSYRQAKTTLERRGLKVGKLIYEPDFAKNNVLKQLYNGSEIKPGTMIEKGKKIDLVLGNGLTYSTAPVPNLVHLNYRQAVNEIHDGYFNIGNVKFDTSVHTYIDSMNATVYKQNPVYAKQKRYRLGTNISIWLSKEFVKLDGEEVETDNE